LEQFAIDGRSDVLIELLCEVVPTFHPLHLIRVNESQ
jgi:hypothetical protein